MKSGQVPRMIQLASGKPGLLPMGRGCHLERVAGQDDGANLDLRIVYILCHLKNLNY